MIPIVEITRIETNPDYGSFGVLTINKEAFCVTLEPYSRDNAPNVSCIPPGQYIAERCDSTWGATFEIMHIEGRSLVKFHPGNWDHETEGCPLLGQYFAKLRAQRAIANSGVTFRNFMRRMEGFDRIHVTIREMY